MQRRQFLKLLSGLASVLGLPAVNAYPQKTGEHPQAVRRWVRMDNGVVIMLPETPHRSSLKVLSKGKTIRADEAYLLKRKHYPKNRYSNA